MEWMSTWKEMSYYKYSQKDQPRRLKYEMSREWKNQSHDFRIYLDCLVEEKLKDKEQNLNEID